MNIEQLSAACVKRFSLRTTHPSLPQYHSRRLLVLLSHDITLPLRADQRE
jgi:hypothetical protein